MASSISVVIPTYNEEPRLADSMEQVAAYLRGWQGMPVEIIIVNDGSTDATAAVAHQLASQLRGPDLDVHVLDNPGNRGKGYSVRHGMLAAKHELVLFSDADLSTPIVECEKLLDVVCHGGYDIAIGSRALDRSLIGVHQPLFREAIGRFFNLAVQLGSGLQFHDTQCGFKLFSRQAADEIFRCQRLEHFGFDVEILYLAEKLGFRTAEVPVRWNHCEGTKVGMFTGADAFLDIWRVRYNDWLGRYNRDSFGEP